MLSYESPSQVRALASLSKGLASLKDVWGLVKWPTVNPKNIRDKIYVILADNGKPMHFSEIAKFIKDSDFKRKDVTTQAIHNELIKDKRFVLIGRGIYALDSWGYSKGTVSDIITKVLKKAGERVDTAADEDEALIFDELIVNRLGRDIFSFEVAILDELGDF
jgi:DNA-directed RNA polymerase delta subunit